MPKAKKAKQFKRKQHRRKKGKPKYQKMLKKANKNTSLTSNAEIISLLTSIKTNTDDLVFKENVGSFKEAYANGKKDALSTSAGWIIDIRKFLDSIPVDGELDKNFQRFREVFIRRFDECFAFVAIDSAGKRFDFETMESIDTVPTDDVSMSGIVAEAFDAGYYVCDGVVVRKQSVSTFTLEGSE